MPFEEPTHCLGLISCVTCWGLRRLWNGCPVGGGRGLCWHKHHVGQRDAQRPRQQVRDLCTGLCETGIGGPGGQLAPRLASLRGVESPWGLLPRSQCQVPGDGGSPRQEASPRAPGPWRPEGTNHTSVTRDPGGRRRSVLPSGSVPGSPCRLHRGLWTPHPVLCPHLPDFSPSRRPSRAPCPSCPAPLTRGRLLETRPPVRLEGENFPLSRMGASLTSIGGTLKVDVSGTEKSLHPPAASGPRWHPPETAASEGQACPGQGRPPCRWVILLRAAGTVRGPPAGRLAEPPSTSRLCVWVFLLHGLGRRFFLPEFN